LIKVVLPAPRKPVITVTDILFLVFIDSKITFAKY